MPLRGKTLHLQRYRAHKITGWVAERTVVVARRRRRRPKEKEKGEHKQRISSFHMKHNPIYSSNQNPFQSTPPQNIAHGLHFCPAGPGRRRLRSPHEVHHDMSFLTERLSRPYQRLLGGPAITAKRGRGGEGRGRTRQGDSLELFAACLKPEFRIPTNRP